MERTTDTDGPPAAAHWAIEHCEVCGYYFADCAECPNGAQLTAWRNENRTDKGENNGQ